MAAESSRPIELDDEIEGDRQGDPDFVFRRVGESVPLKSSDSAFDLSDPPSKPLAVSERLGALFLAHSEGFLVARTKDVIQIAKEIKEKGEGHCIQESSVADVRIGKVSILAVSTDSSMLAAVVGGDILFYSVSSLLNKEQKPSFSCSCDGSPIIKDFKWRKSWERYFLVLSNCSSLFYGNPKDKLKNVADNIDAVDWSVEGDLIVFAKGNALTIFSSDLKEQLSMCLLFKLCPINDDTGHIIKVDCINWVRDDSIVVGCIGVDEGGNEDGYFVQVIKSKEYRFTESSHMPIVYSFPSLFEGISNDILPFGSGPYLLSGYLDRWELILASNKKAVDDHFQLLGWGRTNNSSEVLLLDIQYDQFPTIDLQENGDDNVILGLGIDRVSLYDKVPVQIGSNLEERTPYCILLCLTCEGKLIMFHSVRISEPKGLCQTSLPSLHDNNSAHEASAGPNLNKLPTAMSRSKVDADVVVSDDNLGHIISEGPDLSIDKSTGSTNSGSIGTSKLFASREHTIGTSTGQIPKSNKLPFDLSYNQISDFTLKANSNTGSEQISFSSSGIDTDTALVAGQVSTDASSTIQTNASKITKSLDMVKGPVSVSTDGAIFASQSVKYSANDGSVAKPSTSSFRTSFVNDIPGKSDIDKGLFPRQTSSTVNHLSAGHPFSLIDSVGKSSTLMFSSNKTPLSEGLATSGARSIRAKPVAAVLTSSILTQEASLPAKPVFFSGQPMHPNNRSFKSSQLLNSEQEMSKEFYNIKDMVKELDILLSSIEKEGGFRDACTVFQKSSVVALEEDLENIFEMSRRCKTKLAERLLEIQHLQNKMLQASARQVYMEGIVKQASNEQYWDIWNRQKLSPEFELKRQKIFNAKQDLTNQLIELEKHFNALEIKRFGESGRISAGRGASSSSLEPARQNLSLHALYNTVNSQLTAAQKLSECLSKQMAKLNIDSPIAKRQNLAKELFESIGLTHEPSNYQTPSVQKHGINTDQIKGVLFSPSNDYSTKNMPSISNSAGAEASRRRRDSLDKSLSSFEPHKTTVKRVLQEGHVGMTAEKPLRIMDAFNSQIKGSSLVQTRSNETPASSWNSFINKFQSDDYLKGKGLENFSKHSSESQPKSVFKWAKDLPDFHSVESKSQPVPMLNRNIEPSSSILSSQSHLNVQFNSKKTSGSVAMPVNQATQSGSKQSSSTMETATVSKQSGIQFESPTIGQTFSEVSSISSPTRNKLISRNQAIEQLNLKNAGGPTEALLRSNTQPTTFPHSQPAVSNGSNTSPLALTLAGPSTGLSQNTDRFDGMENNNQQTEFLNALSQESVSVAPIPILSTSAISSTVSLPFTPSVSPNSLPTVSDGVSQAALVSPATSAASDQSAFSTGLLPSQNSPTSTYSPFKSAELKPFTLQSVDVSSATKPTHAEAHPSVDPVSQSEVTSKLEPAVSLAPVKEVSAGLFSKKEPNLLPINTSTTSIVLSTQHELPSTIAPTTISTMNEKDEVVDINSSLEDEMEEEAPDTSVLNLGSLGGFGLGSNPPSGTKPNPFGGSLFGTTASSATFQFSHTTSPGELFRPPSLNLPSAQQVQQTQALHSSNTSGGFSGFGQAAQLGSGQQVLGSVLGSFGQSRQLGSGMAGFGVAGFSAPANSGGFASAGGFANASTGSGFSIASSGGGFAGTPNIGGFAAVASSGGGFAAAAGGGFGAVASGSGGFAAAASSGGGFGGAGQGGGFAAPSSAAGGFGGAGGGFAGSTSATGFGAFNSSQGGGFSAFGSSNSSGTGRPPAALLNQMRK